MIQSWLDTFFSDYQWYRRKAGGKWLYIRVTAIPLWLWVRDRPLTSVETLLAEEQW
jgi:hypothetical protein